MVSGQPENSGTSMEHLVEKLAEKAMRHEPPFPKNVRPGYFNRQLVTAGTPNEPELKPPTTLSRPLDQDNADYSNYGIDSRSM